MARFETATGVLDNCRITDGARKLVRDFQTRGVGKVLRHCPESLPVAQILRATMPLPSVLRDAFDTMDEALNEPSNDAFNEAAIAALVDGLGRKFTTNAANYLAATSEVIGDDEVARSLDLYVVHDFAPIIVAYGMRLLRRRTVYTPTPAEIAAACAEIADKLHDGKAELWGYVLLDEDVENVLAAYGPQQARDEADPRADEIPF
jgi:hypothetical protein